MGGGGGIGGIIGGIIGVALAPETGGLSMALDAGLGSALGTAAGEVATGQQLNPLAIGISGAGGAIGGSIAGWAGGAAGEAGGAAASESSNFWAQSLVDNGYTYAGQTAEDAMGNALSEGAGVGIGTAAGDTAPAGFGSTFSIGDAASGFVPNFNSQAVVDGVTQAANPGSFSGSDLYKAALSAETTPQYYINNYGMTPEAAREAALSAYNEGGLFNSDQILRQTVTDSVNNPAAYANTGLTYAQAVNAAANGISPAEAQIAALNDSGLSSFWSKAGDALTTKATDPKTIAQLGLKALGAVLTPAQIAQQDARNNLPQGARQPQDSVSIQSPAPVTTRAMADAGAGSNAQQPILSVQQAAGGPSIAMPSASGGGGMAPKQVTPVQLGLGGTIQAPRVAGTPDAPWFTNDPALRPLVLRSLGEYYDDSDSSLSRMFTPQGGR